MTFLRQVCTVYTSVRWRDHIVPFAAVSPKRGQAEDPGPSHLPVACSCSLLHRSDENDDVLVEVDDGNPCRTAVPGLSLSPTERCRGAVNTPVRT